MPTAGPESGATSCWRCVTAVFLSVPGILTSSQPILNYNKPPPVKGDTYTEPWISEKMRALLTWAKVKHQKAVVPETNSFGAPLTNERKIRMKHLQFTKLHAACPAPLPKEEYERLRRFALGEESSRPPPRVPFYSQEFGLGPHERPRQMTMRSWRRMYLRVYEKTPMLQQNPATQKWEVTPKEYIPIPEADPEDCEDISEQAVPRRSKPGSRA